MNKHHRRILEQLDDGNGTPVASLRLLEAVMARLNWWEAFWFRSSFYFALADMKDAGLVERTEVPGGPERGGRPRYFYAITSSGEIALDRARGGAKVDVN